MSKSTAFHWVLKFRLQKQHNKQELVAAHSNKYTIYMIGGLKLLTLLLLFLLNSSHVSAQTVDPQYIFVRKNPMSCNPSDCRFLWNMDNPNTITDEAFLDVTGKIGTGNTANTRKVGIGVVFNYWIGDFNRNVQSLNKLLETSKSTKVPVFIVLDGATWWDKKPDLWYWWDPSISAAESEQRKKNVEWTHWDSSYAIKKAWRNWGSEFEVKPPPNLASPAVIRATTTALTTFLIPIADWYNSLPANEKYLFGGVSLGTELDIGGNYYYYPQGIKNGNGLAGSVQIGYNAVKTYGKSSGTITTEDINNVIRTYQTTLNKLAIEKGIPRNKIFNHNGGKGAAPFLGYPPGVAMASFDASRNNYAAPGWSFYGDVTSSPQNYPDLVAALEKTAPSEWSSAEWLPWVSDKNGWMESLRNSLNFRNNRFINIANWEEVRDKPDIISAIKTVAQENPACWVTSPTVSVSVTNGTASFSWQKGAQNQSNYFQYSDSTEYNDDGTLKNLRGQRNVSDQTNHSVTPSAPGIYHWLLTADGCGNQRRNVYGSFEIGSAPSTGFGDLTATSTPTPTQVTPGADTNSIADNSKAMVPFWQGDTVYNESMMFVSQNGGIPEATFLFPVKNIISVKNSALSATYTQGTDWTLTANKLTLPAGSRIPFLKNTDLTPDGTLPASYFHEHQVAVTYSHSGSWKGPIPSYAQTTLPNTISKLAKHEPVKMILYGDSISVGYNISGLLHVAPNLPVWGKLVADSLQAATGSPITFINPSQINQTSTWGAQNAKSLVADQHPDIVIIAFGMNDGVNMPPTILPVAPPVFKSNIQSIMSTVKASNPNTEFILVSPILMNPAYAGSTQGSYQSVLTQLRTTGVELIQMTDVHKELLKTKRYADVSGNNINHPNDYMGRWYAQQIVGLLRPNTTVAPTSIFSGDINADFTMITQGYGTKYTMYDYNELVKFYNK